MMNVSEILEAIEKPYSVVSAFTWGDTKEGHDYWRDYARSNPNDPAFAAHRARLCEMYREVTGQKPRLRVRAVRRRKAEY